MQLHDKYGSYSCIFAPHIAEEVWQMLGHNKTITFEDWPNHDENSLILDKIHLVVSVNGKKRAEIDLDRSLSDGEIKEKVKNIPAINSYIKDKEIKKFIIVKDKLVNIVV